MQLQVSNKAPHARRDWVIFGSERQTEHSCLDAHSSLFLNIARVTVPASFTGVVTTEPPPNEVFRMHRAMYAAMLSGGFTPYVSVNGRIVTLDPAKSPSEISPYHVAYAWVDRTADAIVEMVCYVFHDHPVMQFELRITCGSLQRASKYLEVDMLLGTGPNVTFVYEVDSFNTASTPLKHLYSGLADDAQSFVYTGVVCFYDDRTTPEEADTCAAALHGPLGALAHWSKWGIWGKQPIQQPNRLTAERVDLSKFTKRDPQAHPGAFLLNKRPADAGEQAEFGGWSHVVDVGYDTAELIQQKKVVALRTSCRPIFYFEANGEPIEAVDHPRLVVWSEQFHYSAGVSQDRLGRQHNGDVSTGWFGHDDQHQGWIFVCENYLLTGSIMLRRMIAQVQENWIAAMTLPSTHPNYSTNDPGPGRAVGRFFLTIAQSLRCVWNDRLFQRACKRFDECVWPAYLAAPKGIVNAYTMIGPDPRTGFPTRSSWAAWQDAILVMGIDAFLKVCPATGATRQHMEELVDRVGEAVVQYGYTPAGEEAVAYMPIPGGVPAQSYYDATLCTLATGTAFRNWGMTAVGVVQRRLPALAARCADLRARHEAGARDTYQATLLP